MFFICIYYFTIGHTSLIHNVPCLRSPITIIISSFFVQHWQGNCSCVAKEKWWWWSFFALCLFFIIIALPSTIIHFLHFIKKHCPSNPSNSVICRPWSVTGQSQSGQYQFAPIHHHLWLLFLWRQERLSFIHKYNNLQCKVQSIQDSMQLFHS